MVKVDFDRPGLDYAWTPTHKCAGVYPEDAKFLNLCRQPVYLEEDQIVAHDPPQGDPQVDETLAYLAQNNGGFENSLPDIVSCEGQATASLVEDAPSQALEQNETGATDSVENNLEAGKDQEAGLEGDAHVEEGRQSLNDELAADKNATGSFFTSCWQGIAELYKTTFTQHRSLSDVKTMRGVDAADPELQRALLESVSLDEATQASAAEARKRLERVMDLYHAKPTPVQADGNCQFRAVSVQMYGDQGYHGALRARVVAQLKETPERYADFVHEPYDEYVKRMARGGEWGDNVTLQAASDALGTDIHILTDIAGAEYVEVHPKEKAGASQKPLCLTFLTEVHYDAAEMFEH